MGLNLRNSVGGDTGDIAQGVHNHVVERKQNGHLDQKGQTTAEGAVFFFLIHFLQFFLHLLLGLRIVAARVFLTDSRGFGRQLCLLHTVLLLFDAEVQKKNLHNDGKKEQRQEVVIHQGITYSDNPSQGDCNKVKHTSYRFYGHQTGS